MRWSCLTDGYKTWTFQNTESSCDLTEKAFVASVAWSPFAICAIEDYFRFLGATGTRSISDITRAHDPKPTLCRCATLCCKSLQTERPKHLRLRCAAKFRCCCPSIPKVGLSTVTVFVLIYALGHLRPLRRLKLQASACGSMSLRCAAPATLFAMRRKHCDQSV